MVFLVASDKDEVGVFAVKPGELSDDTKSNVLGRQLKIVF